MKRKTANISGLRCSRCKKVEGCDMVMGIKVIDGICTVCRSKQCSSCGIMVGKWFVEQAGYKVGDYTLCGFCYKKLKQDGKREVQRTEQVIVSVLPDGHTESRQRRLGE